MEDYDITKKVDAVGHTQKALDAVNGLAFKTPETNTMLKYLKEVRKELAYEIYRSEKR